jgi:5-methylcytosine-specific restriction endonuclease McrA
MTSVLESRVLVLNKNYDPMTITTAKEAFKKLFNQLAEVITVEDGAYCNYDFNSWAELSDMRHQFQEISVDDDLVHTPVFTIVVPRVIRMLTYDRVPKRRVKLSRRNIYARDNNTCQYCGKKLPTTDLNIDHIVPKCQGGRTTWTNVVCSCFKCNQKKGGSTPKQAGMKLIRKPVKPKHNPTMLIHIGDVKYSSWKNFISETYWTRELEN